MKYVNIGTHSLSCHDEVCKRSCSWLCGVAAFSHGVLACQIGYSSTDKGGRSEDLLFPGHSIFGNVGEHGRCPNPVNFANLGLRSASSEKKSFTRVSPEFHQSFTRVSPEFHQSVFASISLEKMAFLTLKFT